MFSSNTYPLLPIPYSLSFHALAYSFALFCKRAKLNSFHFIGFRTLSQKHPGVGHPFQAQDAPARTRRRPGEACC
jgi:hypothetical protein